MHRAGHCKGRQGAWVELRRRNCSLTHDGGCFFVFFSKHYEWMRAAPFTEIGDALMSAAILLPCLNHVFADYIHLYIQPCETFLCKSHVQSSCYSSMAVFSFKPYRLDLYSQHASAHRSLLLSYIISQPAHMEPHFGRQISCRNLTGRCIHTVSLWAAIVHCLLIPPGQFLCFCQVGGKNNLISVSKSGERLIPGHSSHLLSSKDTDWSDHVLTLKWEV